MVNEVDKNLHNVISILKYPVISDKTTRLLETNKYTFMVDRRANKVTIKKVTLFARLSTIKVYLFDEQTKLLSKK